MQYTYRKITLGLAPSLGLGLMLLTAMPLSYAQMQVVDTDGDGIANSTDLAIDQSYLLDASTPMKTSTTATSISLAQSFTSRVAGTIKMVRLPIVCAEENDFSVDIRSFAGAERLLNADTHNVDTATEMMTSTTDTNTAPSSFTEVTLPGTHTTHKGEKLAIVVESTGTGACTWWSDARTDLQPYADGEALFVRVGSEKYKPHLTGTSSNIGDFAFAVLIQPVQADNCAMMANPADDAGIQANNYSADASGNACRIGDTGCLADTEGDACDNSDGDMTIATDDSDSMPIYDAADNCPLMANPRQENANAGDGEDEDNDGDVCDSDSDSDGDLIFDNADNCPSIDNPADENGVQTDTDMDGEGDACDLDDDNDGVADFGPDEMPDNLDGSGIIDDDKCAATPMDTPVAANGCLDTDGDGIADDGADGDAETGDDNDNCPMISNGGQDDRNDDGVGDACEASEASGFCFPVMGENGTAVVCL